MSAIEDQLIEWIKARHEEDGAVELDAATDLFETGLLDSLGFVAMVTLVEEMTGRVINMEKIRPENIHTVAAIAAEFFTPPTEAVLNTALCQAG